MKKSGSYSRFKSIQKTSQKNLTNHSRWYSMIFICLGLILVIWLFSNQRLNIQTIQYSSDYPIASEVSAQIWKSLDAQKSWWYNSYNILALNPANLNQSILDQFPEISSVVIQKYLPHTITISLELRKPLLKSCGDLICAIIAEDGVVIQYDNPESPQPDILEIRGLGVEAPGKSLLSEREAQWMYTIFSTYRDISFFNLQRIEVKERASDKIALIHLYTTQGYYVIIDAETDTVYQREVLAIALENIPDSDLQKLEYIDLRVQDRVYYKLQ